MRPRLPIAVVAVIAVSAALAGAAGAASRTIRVTSVTVSMVSHDVGPKGASKGDTIVYRDRLVNAAPQFGREQGVQVGTDSGTMTFTSPHTATFKGKVVLPGGTLTLSGAVYSTADGLVVPVTGGTGVFAHVRGTLLVGQGRNHVPNTYRLTSVSGPLA
jgi:Dirigent-like protein